MNEQEFQESINRIGKAMFAEEQHENSEIDEAESAHADMENELLDEMRKEAQEENGIEDNRY